MMKWNEKAVVLKDFLGLREFPEILYTKFVLVILKFE